MKTWGLRIINVDLGITCCAMIMAGLLAGPASHAQTLTTLHSFNGTDGATPQSPLAIAGTNLYGATMFGGANSQGTVFKLNIDGTGFQTLYDFADSDIDGNAANPYGPLIVSEGAVYGTASGLPSGTVFKIKADGSGQSVLHVFSGGLDGDMPFGGLILSSNLLYGTTFEGGNIFQVDTNGAEFSSLHCLSCETNVHTDASAMYAGLVLVDGWLYGATYGGGSSNVGTIFKIHTGGANYTVLHEFTGADGAYPWSGLLYYNNKLYGTTAIGGGPGASGVVFAINPDGTGFTNLHQFTGLEGGGVHAGLVAANNVLYGAVMTGGGVGAQGALFSLNIDGSGFKQLYVFSGGADGGAPAVSLTLSGNALYGSTTQGGGFGQGTLFRFSLPAVPASAAITYSRSNIVLAWPTNSSTSLLQTSTNLIDWTPVSQTPQIINGQYAMTNPITGDRQFFRLSH